MPLVVVYRTWRKKKNSTITCDGYNGLGYWENFLCEHGSAEAVEIVIFPIFKL
jgi:hypothetical protein